MISSSGDIDGPRSADTWQLTDLLEEIARRIRSGEPVDLNEYARAHPEYAEQLNELFPAVKVLADGGLFRSDRGSSVSAADKATPSSEVDDAKGSIAGTLGDYRIVREIGCGGMGIVYEAEQTSLGRRVALKVLPLSRSLDARQRQRFENEARAAAALYHPNIVPVYCVGCERAVHFYAMQYIDGRTLASVIHELRARQSPEATGEAAPLVDPVTASIPASGADADRSDSVEGDLVAAGSMGADVSEEANERRRTAGRREDGKQCVGLSGERSVRDTAFFQGVARLGIQAAEALEYAHQMGVVHRDIKPSNLMLDVTGNLWIGDFGLAQSRTGPDITMTGEMMGTLHYMSPEQIECQHHVMDHRTDIYSLGVTLYELLTLEWPFDSKGRAELIGKIVGGACRRPRRVNPLIPRDLETIVLKAMATEPGNRYATAAELAVDLQSFLEGKPIQARPISLPERAAKWARRHRSLVSMFVVLLMAAVTALGISVFLIARKHVEMVRQRDDARQQRTLVLEREGRLRRRAYAAQVHRAWLAWQDGRLGKTQQDLLTWLPEPGHEDLRSFAWYYLWASCHTPSKVLNGHAGPVYCVAYSPDGKILASGSQDHTIVFWDPATGKKLRTLRGHTDDVNHIAFSLDGKVVATAGEDHVVQLWNSATGSLMKRLTGFQLAVNSALFTPDGKTLVATEGRLE